MTGVVEKLWETVWERKEVGEFDYWNTGGLLSKRTHKLEDFMTLKITSASMVRI